MIIEFGSCHLWVSPREKSEEKGQRQKVKFKLLNMKENKATESKSKFLATLFCVFGAYLVILSLGRKMLIF